jgi:hypothetical protein
MLEFLKENNMEDQHTKDFFLGLCKDEEEKFILEMLLSGMKSEDIIEKYLETYGDNIND